VSRCAALTIAKHHRFSIRHHRLASGAGADRVSQGMCLAFGTPLAISVLLQPYDIVL
jgi:hypothetical protein